MLAIQLTNHMAGPDRSSHAAAARFLESINELMEFHSTNRKLGSTRCLLQDSLSLIMASLLDLSLSWYEEPDRYPRILLMVVVLNYTKEFLKLNPCAVHQSFKAWDNAGVNDCGERLDPTMRTPSIYSHQTLHNYSLAATEAEEELCPDVAALVLDKPPKNGFAFTFGRDPSRRHLDAICSCLALSSAASTPVSFQTLSLDRGWFRRAQGDHPRS